LSPCTRIIPHHNRAQHGAWEREIGFELAGKTLGIIGLGRIGKKVAARLQGFEMRIIANDIAPDHEFAARRGIPFVSLDELLADSDVVSLHVPLTPLTEHMINAHTIGKMKRGAVLLNAARGPVVDAAALAAALDSGHIAGAGLDVYTMEWRVDEVFLNRSNVVDHPYRRIHARIAAPDRRSRRAKHS
jgi:phosphoglycerate dehydrogenase-like enzyme